jgi:hypothetical protein
MWIASVMVRPCNNLFGRECICTRRFPPKQTKLASVPFATA